MITTERTIEERYEAVHEAILAGPNALLQKWVDTGQVWLLEGHIGRTAQRGLQDGALVLPPHQETDFYGSQVPSYHDIEDEQG
ncbi:MAG: hypothetical protein ACXWZI_16335, partial [Mycobacterium sp.]